ncbi:autotransporter outer membrane beta-barrel domain-containing protein [Rickettsia sp. TH2014]|nr:autotransporter outer membrane beta-barrel domain-containing protein [Rickettsia sp. TH2014]
MMLTATLDAKAHPSVESEEVTVQSPQGNNSNTSRWFKFKNPLSHLSNILGFNSGSTAPKAQEKPITIEELQDLYNNDPDEQLHNNFNNVNTSFNFAADGSATLSRDSIYFMPQDNLVTKDWDEETIYSEPWDDTALAEGLPSAPPLEYLASAPSDNDLPLPSAQPAEGITETEKAAIEILDQVLDGDSAYDTLSDDTISDTSSEHSLESDCSISTTPSIPRSSDQNQGVKTEIGGMSITIPNHFFAVDKEDTSSLSNFSENDDEWDDEEDDKWSKQAIEDVAKRVTPESNDTTNTEPVNTFNGSDTTKSSTSVPIQDLPKIVGCQYKEPLIPNNHYKAKQSSTVILAELEVKDELQQTLSRRRAVMEIEEDDEVEGLDEENEISSPTSALQSAPPADAIYSKLSASEEARQTIERNKSAIAKNKALLEAKYATIAKSRLGLAYKDPDTKIGDAFTSEFESKNNEQVIDNDDTALILPPPPTEAELALMDTGIISNSNDINATQTIDYDVLEKEQDRLPLPPYPVTEVDREKNISEIIENADEDLLFPPPPTAEELQELGIVSDVTEDDAIEDLPFPPPPSEDELAALDQLTEVSNLKQAPVTMASISSELQEESEYHGDSDILTQETVEDDDIQNSITEVDVDAASSEPCVQATSIDKEEMLKKAAMVAASHNQARNMSKIASHQIKHRIFAKDIVTAAVAAGDEEAGGALDDAAEKTHGYSIWSSGTLGSNKQKSKADLNGYSTKIAGGTIGLELNLENDLLVGGSFSKCTSRVKYQDQGGSSDLRSSTASTSTKYDTHIFSLYGSRPVSRDISMSVIGSAGYSKGTKASSKLLSLEPHLHYRIELPRAVTLIPHIGLRYEYEKASRHKEQIASNLSIEHSKKSYQAFNGEIGSRVIFAPIKLNGSTSRAISITPTAHFSVERRIGSRGKSHPFTLTYYESKQTIGTGTISTNAQNERTSLNAGVGLIASRKNIKLELLYDHTRQKRFKSHQGVLKLKVSL